MSASISRTANWRRGLKTRHPHDLRLERAADKLEQFADETSNLTDEAWTELEPFYSWNSETWSDAVSKTSRLVEFQPNVRTFPDFINNLVGFLQHASN
jgi:hypothetical protein